MHYVSATSDWLLVMVIFFFLLFLLLFVFVSVYQKISLQIGVYVQKVIITFLFFSKFKGKEVRNEKRHILSERQTFYF